MRNLCIITISIYSVYDIIELAYGINNGPYLIYEIFLLVIALAIYAGTIYAHVTG